MSYRTRVEPFEDLFSPEIEGNIISTVLDSLLQADLFSRVILAKSIILVGGTTMVPGFKR